MEPLMDRVLREWRGKRVAITIGSEHSFTGILEDFDGEVLLLRNVVDVVGNRGKAMIVALEDVSWIMLLE
ncbi:LSm family protein [Pyrococcus yayanosii]|uniref:LSM domain-containing protein n=1 Tax=Pyrococcus yayanosii (strain CH1 / JCM 16557) TaxID=529709 RepID=F8AHM5_PYRYC|nr:LSm family protein [Pyrococcus yayanosii]AEH25397.1 hypothetical protein PYCH_17380 [Pyrococcus yayanosii CH1]